MEGNEEGSTHLLSSHLARRLVWGRGSRVLNGMDGKASFEGGFKGKQTEDLK